LTYLAAGGFIFMTMAASPKSAGPRRPAASATPFAQANENLDDIQTALERPHLSALGS